MKNQQSGFSLIEALIAALVMSVAVAGFAASQMVSTRASNLGLQRNIVTSLGNDLVDRVRRNIDVAVTGGMSFSGQPTLLVDCTANNCTPAQRGNFEIVRWYTQMRAQLVSATASLSCAGTCAAGEAMTLIVAYDGLQTGATGACKDPADSSYDKTVNRICTTMRFVP